jgi:DNA repair and recombination protein RAD54 and RAD54-like protein
MGRVYRQGQTKPCTIYRLFSTGTLEEVIYQRQIQKGGLSSLTVDAGSTAHDAKFSKEEIKDCFTLKENCQCDTKLKMGKSWCEYSGADCIDCDDPPLLEVAKSCKDTLSFVHIVEETEAAVHADSSNTLSASKSADLDSSSDDEEFDLRADSTAKKPTESESSSDDEFEL